MKLGKWDVEIEYEPDVNEWVAKLRFDTGCIIERAPRRWEAMAQIRDHWEALRIMGEFQ